MTKKYIIIVTFAFILGIIGFQVLNESDKNQSPGISAPPESLVETSDLLDVQANNEGPVSITVTPQRSDNEWAFEMVLDTHSMDIEENPANVSVLTDEKGNEYKPIEWQGDPPGGHHLKGILKFALISPEPQSIVLKVFQVGGIEERNFIWSLK